MKYYLNVNVKLIYFSAEIKLKKKIQVMENKINPKFCLNNALNNL